MSGQALDLRRSAQIVRWRKALASVFVALGLLAGVTYTALSPPVYLSSALVAVSPSVGIASQAAIVTSPSVLSLALPRLDRGMTLDALHDRIQAGHAGAGLMAVSAYGTTPAQAIRTANAVATSYVEYAGSASNPSGSVPVQVFQQAVSATGTPLAGRLLYAAGPGVLAGALIGVIVVLAVGRNDRRLRERDGIADSIGVPVLASFRVGHLSKAAAWAKLLRGYEPGNVDAWRLRKALHELGVPSLDPAGLPAGGRFSLAVLSLAGDRRALALGPQLALFASSLGIPTTLVVGPQQAPGDAAALRAACAEAPEPREGLRVIVSEDGDASQLPPGVLAVVVAVVDGETPRVASTMRATATVLGVTSGAVTAQQLTRVAASAASDGRYIAGILVANPDPADQTTGRLPQLARPGEYRMPTRMTGAVTEIV
jgi:capsular polysaccharide biosynthesis protein